MSSRQTPFEGDDASMTQVISSESGEESAGEAASESVDESAALRAEQEPEADPGMTREAEGPVTATLESEITGGDDGEETDAPPRERASIWSRVKRPGTKNESDPEVPTLAEAAAAAAAASAAAGNPPTPRAPGGPRRVRLAVSRIDPWSVMKLSFLLSIAIGIALVVATAVIWNVLNTMQVFTQADGIVTDIAGSESFINILDYVEFSRVMSISVVIAVIDVVILTAISTLFAFLYNVTAALVGGLHVTLTDE